MPGGVLPIRATISSSGPHPTTAARAPPSPSSDPGGAAGSGLRPRKSFAQVRTELARHTRAHQKAAAGAPQSKPAKLTRRTLFSSVHRAVHR